MKNNINTSTQTNIKSKKSINQVDITRDEIDDIIDTNRVNHLTPTHRLISKEVDKLVDNFESETKIKVNSEDLDTLKRSFGVYYKKTLNKYFEILKTINHLRLPKDLNPNGLFLYIDELYYIVTEIKTPDDILNHQNIEIIYDLFESINMGDLEEYVDSIDDISSFYDLITNSESNLIIAYQDEGIYKSYTGWLQEKYRHIVDEDLGFDPEIELKKILSLPRDKKRGALDIWKQKYKENLDIISKIIIDIHIVSDIVSYDMYSKAPSSEKFKDEVYISIINEILPNLQKLSREQKEQILIGLDTYLEKKIYSIKKINDEKYIKSPKLLLEDTLDIDISNIRGKVILELVGAHIIAKINRNSDFNFMYSGEKISDRNSKYILYGYVEDVSTYDGLLESVAIINNRKKDIDINEIVFHETRHLDNQILLKEQNSDTLVKAKDEILAFLTGGVNIDEIEDLLLNFEELGSYDYFTHIKSSEKYKTMVDMYKKDLKKSFNIVKKLASLHVSNYIELLTIVPIRKWHLLEKLYIK